MRLSNAGSVIETKNDSYIRPVVEEVIDEE